MISSDLKLVVVIFNTKVKNNVTTLISHIYCHSNEVKKTIYHTVNITSTKAKLFAIRYEINQAIHIPDVSHIIIITNTIHSALCIFDSIVNSYQQQSIAIVKNLRNFFLKHSENSIKL